MQLSLIIPTLNRQRDLPQCLDSIIKNTLLPDEIIIVEQGNVEKTQQVCEKFNSKVKIELIPLQEKSLCKARNVGIDEAKGSIILFLDDDSTIHKEYIQKTIDKFKAYPSIQCAFGENKRTKNIKIFSPYRLIFFFFGIITFKKGFTIMRSGDNRRLHPPPIDLDCQWAPGCVSYRKKVVEQFRFNEHFTRYCLREDMYLSHQVYKHYGKGSIGYFEDIVFDHVPSEASRITNKSVVKMDILYRYIFWKNEVYEGKFINFLCYLMSILGAILQLIYPSQRTLINIKKIPIVLSTYLYIMKNYRKIDRNEIDYNGFIFSL